MSIKALQVDSNGNGTLDSREVEVLLNTLAADALGEGRRVSKQEIRNVMEKVDSNKDRRIAFDEFIRVRPWAAPLVLPAPLPAICHSAPKNTGIVISTVWHMRSAWLAG